MSDDSETVEDTEKGSLAEVTDDSCTVEFIEIEYVTCLFHLTEHLMITTNC